MCVEPHRPQTWCMQIILYYINVKEIKRAPHWDSVYFYDFVNTKTKRKSRPPAMQNLNIFLYIIILRVTRTNIVCNLF